MNTIVSTNFEQLHNAVPLERREQAVEYWADQTLKTVKSEMPFNERYGAADIAVVKPIGDVDETKTLVLPLEFNQGVTPAHYMRAKMVQQYAAPSSRVVILPNSGYNAPHVNMDALSERAKERMASGDYRPYAQLLEATMYQADKVHNFGRLAIIGSSQGALTGLAFASSEHLDVRTVLAFETPSKTDRTAGQLGKDFQKSGGGPLGLKRAIADSEIRAQRQAMSFPVRYTSDIIKFGIRTLTNDDAKLLRQSMTGSAEYLAAAATELEGSSAVDFVHVEGSRIFDPSSISQETQERTSMLRLEGSRIEKQAHSVSNNLRLLAALAYRSANS